MAVAEKTTAAMTTQRNPRQQLMLHSIYGGLYVLAGLWLVFMGLPTLWRIMELGGVSNELLADSLLFLVTLPTIFGIFVLGRYLEGPNPIRGLRAGAFYLAASVIAFGLLITSGSPLWTVIGLVLLAGSIILFFQPRCLDWLVHCEESGWFHAVSFKGNQGLRVRRTTVIAVMILVLCGIYTLVQHNSLHTGSNWLVAKPFASDVLREATDPWIVTMPFSTTSHFVFMYFIPLTIPIVLLGLAGWFAWRLVNWPTFADFLIATEAEMNKVSWTTRKRLYQDTIVVLVTVFLMTVFLFAVDILWIKILTNPLVDVLKHDPQAAARRNQSAAQW